MDQVHPVAELGQTLRRGRQGHRVTIEPADRQAAVGRQQRGRMPSPSNGGVDHQSLGHRGKERDNFITQDRNVFERVDHLQPPDRFED